MATAVRDGNIGESGWNPGFAVDADDLFCHLHGAGPRRPASVFVRVDGVFNGADLDGAAVFPVSGVGGWFVAVAAWVRGVSDVAIEL